MPPSDAPWANIDDVLTRAFRAWRPPPKLTLSQWADQHFRLSAESAAQPGRWTTLPYQREMMDCLTDPRVEKVTLMKSARIGYTMMVTAFQGYHIDYAPAGILVVQPTEANAKRYSKEYVAVMIRDCPRLSKIMFEDAEEAEGGPKGGRNTILHKMFPGGVLSLVGANSGAGLRMISRQVVIADEADAYPPSAGSDGDPIELAVKRSATYYNRKIIVGSTPLEEATSRIAQLFREGDQRRYFVPCPQCGHMAPFVFSRRTGEGDDKEEISGHRMRWPEGKPDEAFFECERSGCVIEHKFKRWMIERGEWRAGAPSGRREKIHASFHIWAAYSYAANATWADIAREFLAAKKSPLTLKTFVNTVLGETWKERGEAPAWELIYGRRERYQVGTVPDGVRFLTCGVDVQKSGWYYEVVGWAADKESWSIDAGFIPGRPEDLAAWTVVDELVSHTYPRSSGEQVGLSRLAVDSGDQTSTVYTWARAYPLAQVLAVKGEKAANLQAPLGLPRPVDLKDGGKRLARGYKYWPVGSAFLKVEFYGALKLKEPGPGYCHFPEYGEEYFKQITGEHRVTHRDARGYPAVVWELLPGRENHWLDCRVYARAAASLMGLDRAGGGRGRGKKVAPWPADLEKGPGRNFVGPDGKVFEEHEDPKQQALLERLGARPVEPQGKPARKPREGFLSGRRGGGKGWLG